MGVLPARNRRRRADGAPLPLPRGRSLVRGVVALGTLAALAWTALQLDAWAGTSERFVLKTVRVTGLRRATEGELLRLASVSPGANLWSLDPKVVAQAMSAHPWVRSVDVRRGLPDALDVRVEERTPAALAVLGDLYVVDQDGQPFKRVSAAEALDLPLLTGVDREAAAKDPAGTAARYREALAVADAYARAPSRPRQRLSEVHLGEAGFDLVTADGVRIVLGRGDVDEQLRRLARVRAELEARGVAAAAIHLENRVRPGWVAVQLEGAGATARPKR